MANPPTTHTGRYAAKLVRKAAERKARAAGIVTPQAKRAQTRRLEVETIITKRTFAADQAAGSK